MPATNSIQRTALRAAVDAERYTVEHCRGSSFWSASEHAPHWHGNVLTSGAMRLDVMELLTMGMQVADMVPDDPGIWMFHCHVSNHFIGGMSARYQVLE